MVLPLTWHSLEMFACGMIQFKNYIFQDNKIKINIRHQVGTTVSEFDTTKLNKILEKLGPRIH